MGVHVRTCRDAPPHPWLVGGTYLVTSNPHTKFEHNRSSRSWDTEARCARAHVQRYPPMNCVKHLVHDPQLTHQNWTKSAKPFLRYRSAVCTCARAEIPNPWLVENTLVMTRNTHTPNLNTIGRALCEIEKRGVHVRTCRDTPSVTTA